MAKRKDVRERFLNKVNPTDTCWLWTAWIERNGYRPDHLEVVTASENVRRMTALRTPYQSLRECCPNGGPYDDENTVTTATGRACLTCKRDANRAYYERNRKLTIERARQWRLANIERSREVTREAQRRRRAKKKEQAA